MLAGMWTTKAKLLSGAVLMAIGILGSQLIFPLLLPKETFPKLLTQAEVTRLGVAFTVAGFLIGLGCPLLLAGIRDRLRTRKLAQ